MRIAIIGSRWYPDLKEVWDLFAELPLDTTVISGGAVGVDETAARCAFAYGMKLKQFLPDYNTHGRRAPLERNQLIVDACDRLVAFWDGKSTGTMHTVGLARRAGKPVDVRTPRGSDK